MKKEYNIDFEIYTQDAVIQALDDFSEVGNIELKGGNIIIFGDSDSEIEEIFNELMNYVLGLVN